MHCANPACCCSAEDLTKGTLRLVELEVPPDERLIGIEGGFPVCVARSRYFWLCAKCSKLMRVTGWTATGVTLMQIRTAA